VVTMMMLLMVTMLLLPMMTTVVMVLVMMTTKNRASSPAASVAHRSFSTTGGLEGAYEIKNGKLVSFSEQMLVDCDHKDSGCSGGLMDNAYSFIHNNGGLWYVLSRAADDA
jgi:hypothetical protein